MALSFWKTGAGGQLDFTDNVKTGEYLARESGLFAAHTRAKNALRVIEKPEAQLDKYNQELLQLAARAGDMMNKDLERLYNLGYPKEQCEEVAERKARRFMEDESSIIKAAYPFIDDDEALYTITAKAGVKIADAQLPAAEVRPPVTRLAPAQPHTTSRVTTRRRKAPARRSKAPRRTKK